jgi:NAD(P)-dependent dehydrogenase (short-subunit alcohol dehydrogenase family)
VTDSSATAVIFGGSSGIGESLATLLLRQGVKVVVADLQPPIKELPSYTFLPVDVCDRTAVKAVLQQSQPVDYCFNCAGILREGDSLSIPESDWDASLSVNLTGTINTSLEAYSIMAKQRHGHIVNLASSAALFPWPYMLPYVTSKYAVLGFTIGLRDEAAEVVNSNETIWYTDLYLSRRCRIVAAG